MSNASVLGSAPFDSGVHARGTPARRPRVLIVDDEPLIANVLARLLADDFQVMCAVDGHKALALIEGVTAEHDRFDAILCDLTMPEMNGIDVHERLSITCPDAAARMIFMTGGAVTSRARAFVAAASNEVLDKPLDMDELRAALQRCVGELEEAHETA